MRRLLTLLLSLIAVCAATALVACGDEEGGGEFSVSAADAAEATRNAEAAKVKFAAKVSGGGLPSNFKFTGEGVTATAAPKMDMTFDLGPVLQLAGAGGDGKTRILLDGKKVFVDPPAMNGLELPNGAKWVTADLGQLMKAFGVDAEGFGELFRISPDQQLAALKAAGSVKEVGREKVDGVETVHLKGTVKPSDYVKVLPDERREAVEKALKELEKLPGNEGAVDVATPVDMWIDEDNLLRKMVQVTSMPAQNGQPAGKIEMTMTMSDYGTKLDVQAPPSGEVWDATDAIKKNLPAAAAAGVPSPN